MSKTILLCFTMLLLVFGGCSKKDDLGFTFENKQENLQKLIEEIYNCAHGGDVKRGAALTKSLIPTESQLTSVIKDGVDASMIKRVIDMQKKFQFPATMGDKEISLAMVSNKAQSEVQIHAATTEEIIASERGTAAYMEFPGGAKRVAEAMLKEGVTFYEVELLEPGNQRGMKYHLFFWNGSSWSMFGPAWRVIQ